MKTANRTHLNERVDTLDEIIVLLLPIKQKACLNYVFRQDFCFNFSF